MGFGKFRRIYSIDEHLNWFKSINEKGHYFEGDNNSAYRSIIKHISNTIYEQRYDKADIKLYKSHNLKYYLYNFHLPFINVPRMNIIDKLKIYVRYIEPEEGIDVYIVCSDNSINPNDYNNDELPLFKSLGTHINCMSIVMDIPINYPLEQIMKDLLHEFRHALDYIANQKLSSDVSRYTVAQEQLHDLAVTDRVELFNNYYSSQLYNSCAICCYYCQKTEVDAHIETAISEARKEQISRVELLHMLREPNNDEYAILYRKILPTFYNYADILYWLKTRSNYSSIWYTNVQYASDKICKALNYNKTFKQLLINWHKIIQSFFYKLGQIVLEQY